MGEQNHMTNEKIEQITADNKTIDIDGTQFTINPLTVNEFLKAQLIGQNQNEKEALLEMFKYSLKEEDINKQGIKDAPAKFMQKVQNAVTEINDFEDFFEDEEKQEALNKLQ